MQPLGKAIMDLGFQAWHSSVQSLPSTWRQKRYSNKNEISMKKISMIPNHLSSCFLLCISIMPRDLASNTTQTDDIVNEEKGVQSTVTQNCEVRAYKYDTI